LIHAASLALALAAVWLLLSGHTDFVLLGLGAASVFGVVLIALRMDVVDHEGQPVHMGLRLIAYYPWLGWEIIKANWDVARRIIDPKLPISPTLTSIKSTQRTELGQVMFANSITLTPGTVSVRVLPGEILVHALSKNGADDLVTGRMDRRVSAIEGPEPDSDIGKEPG
jgi:multicomponent Na+:H+ antiporter subunit E